MRGTDRCARCISHLLKQAATICLFNIYILFGIFYDCIYLCIKFYLFVTFHFYFISFIFSICLLYFLFVICIILYFFSFLSSGFICLLLFIYLCNPTLRVFGLFFQRPLNGKNSKCHTCLGVVEIIWHNC